MILKNKLSLTDQDSLDIAEEKLGKKKAKLLFDSGDINKVDIGTYAGLQSIHSYLFEDLYNFAGKFRQINMTKGSFMFANADFLESIMRNIDSMPQSSFDEIIEKYVEMNVAHPFRDGNGRATRIWLDLIIKKELKQTINWSKVGKEDYFSAMGLSVTNDTQIKALLKQALSDDIHSRNLFITGIDVSFYYEGFHAFKTDEL